jgi:hypothetical protein
LSDQCDFLAILSPEKKVLCLGQGIKELEDRKPPTAYTVT